MVARVAIGFVAAALAVLIFHQGMWALLHVLAIKGMTMPPPFPMDGIPPLGVPRILNLCFWGGLYGAAFGAVVKEPSGKTWLCGLLTGLIAAFVGLFIVAAIKGLPIAGGWNPLAILRSILINGFWGIGLGLIYPQLLKLTR